MLIHLDLESRSKEDLQKSGQHRYAQHHTTQVLCVSFAESDTAMDPLVWYPYHDYLSDHLAEDTLFECASDPNVMFAAFNASFESSMWWEQISKKFGMPSIPIERWQCTAAQARAVSISGKLSQVAKVLGLEEQKDKEGTALMRKMCILKNVEDLPAVRQDDLLRLGAYCQQDVRTEKAVHRRLPPMTEHEQRIYVVDQKINKRGVRLNVPLIEKAVGMMGESIADANEEIQRLTGGKIKTIGQVKAIQNFACDHGVKMESCTAKDLDEKLADPNLDLTVRRVLTLRRSAGRAAIKKYPAMLTAICRDGIVRDHLMYCGAARTRRWSGQRLQTQNIARGFEEFSDIETACATLSGGSVPFARLMYGHELYMLASLVRSMLVPSDGRRFVQSDFSGIEARVLAVITGNQMLLDDFFASRDPYKTMASLIYNEHYSAITQKQRFFGKQAVLGLGYGMGAKKFRETCATYGQEIEHSFAQHVVDTYREKNPMVPAFWKRIEADALRVISRRKAVHRKYYGFRWDERLDALVMVLPNGSERWYVNAGIELREKWGKQAPTIVYWEVDSVTRRWSKAETYGGKLTENLDQSIAREIQADALLAVDGAGLDIVLHAHDEVVTDVPEGEGSVDELVYLITTASNHWAAGWPIGAEGWEGPCYKK